MGKENIENFLLSTQEFIDCKFLVAEYKLQKMLQALADASDVCALVGECLEQFNRDREFSKAFVQDGNGDFVFVLPDEEYKIIALVFCTLVDIDAKKIDLTDFVKRFFGREENPYKAFTSQMIVPFRDLIAEAFGYGSASEDNDENEESAEEEKTEETSYQEEGVEEDKFEYAQKIAVQIISQLEYTKKTQDVEIATKVCRAIVKTSKLKDLDTAQSLVYLLHMCKIKQIKFLSKELYDLFN